MKAGKLRAPVERRKRTEARLILVDRPGLRNPTLLCFSTGSRVDTDYAAIEVMNTELATFSSRINMNLREQHGTRTEQGRFLATHRAAECLGSYAGVRTDRDRAGDIGAFQGTAADAGHADECG